MAPKKKVRKAAGAEAAADSSSGEDENVKANSDPASRKLDEMQKRAECPICFEIYDDPRSLPACAHTLCWKCAKPLIQGSKLVCPICRAVSDLAGPGGAVKELPRNCIVASLVEPLHQQQAAAARVSCGNCDATAAEVTCGRCEVHLCAGCSATIHKMRAFKQHDVQPYRAGASASALSRAFTCPAHAGEPLRYCKEQRAEVCLQCISAGDHAGHAHTSIAEGAAALAGELAAALEARKADLAALKVLQEQQGRVSASIDEHVASAKEVADARAKELHASVDIHHANWLAELEARRKAASEAARRQLEHMEAMEQQLKEAVEFSTPVLATDPLRAVRLQPSALARLAAAARGGLPQVVEPKGVSFQPSGVELTVSGGGPVKDDASSGKARVEVPWKPELQLGDLYYSDTFFCCGWPWRLAVFPKGETDGKGTNVSLFLHTCIDKFPRAHELKVEKYTMSVVGRNFSGGPRSWMGRTGWGARDFMPIKELVAQNVKDGAFVVEVSVEKAQFGRK